MIDWLSFKANILHVPITGGQVACVDASGNVEWCVERMLPVQGSHDARVQVKTIEWFRDADSEFYGKGMIIQVSGNPAKFIQGHNLFGSDDVGALATEMTRRIFASLGQEVYIPAGGLVVELTRVDVTYNFRLGSRSQVHDFIGAAATVIKGRKQGARVYGHQTLIVGEGSRRKSLKIYCKGDELEKHKLPHTMTEDELGNLSAYADPLLRVELSLKSMELKRLGLRQSTAWNLGKPEQVFREALDMLQLPENVELVEDQVLKLPGRLVGAYELWRQGRDVEKQFSRATFYRYRRELLAYGIDITIKPRNVQKNNVVPLLRYLKAAPAAVPIWAKGSPLYFEGRKKFGS